MLRWSRWLDTWRRGAATPHDDQAAGRMLAVAQQAARFGVWEHDVRRDSVTWSPHLLHLLDLGAAPPNLALDTIERFLDQESVPMFRQALAAEEALGRGHDLQIVMVTARSRRFWVHSRGFPAFGPDGRLSRRTVVVQDITLQKTSNLAQLTAWSLQRRTSDQLQLTLDGAQVALLAIDVESGRTTHAQRWELFGYSRVPATLEGWHALVHPEDRPARQAQLQRSIEDGTPDDAEFRLQDGGGGWRWVRARGRIVQGQRGTPKQFAGVVMDISEQVMARELVREQSHFVRAILESVDAGVLLCDETQVTYANQSMCHLLGYPDNEAIAGTPLETVFTPEALQAEMARRARLDASLPVAPAVDSLLRRNGTPAPVALVTSRVKWGGRSQYVVRATSLAEQDMLEAHIRATQVRFERLLIDELEQQQVRIARELHDSLGSELAGLCLTVGAARHSVERGADPRAQLDAAEEQLRKAAELTRHLARGLVPVSETPGGLVAALERLARDFSRSGGVQCSFHAFGSVREISQRAGDHVYRIAQEAITNAVRHGRAATLDIFLVVKPQGNRLTVVDDGIGIAPELPASQLGLGVRSMMARARAIDGRLRLKPGAQGTRVTLTWRND